MKCTTCNSERIIKKGFQNKKQRFYCKDCKKYFQSNYRYNAYKAETNTFIKSLLKESCSVRGVSRVLKISKNTVLSRMLKISKQIKVPYFNRFGCRFEVDEMFIKMVNKDVRNYLTYAIEKRTKSVIGFAVGSRSSDTIKPVIDKVLLLNPSKVYTDGLNVYPRLIPEKIHKRFRYCTDTFEKVQLIMSGRYKPKFRTLSEIDAKLPLRGFLTCPSCSKNLTGSGSKGRGGKKSYFFYHCTRHCGVRFKAREVNSLFEQLLHELAIEEDLETVYKSLLNKRLSDNQTSKQIEIASLQREQQKIQDRLTEAEDKYFDGGIDANTYNNIKLRADERLLDIRNTLKETQHQDRFFEKHLRQGATFLKDIHSVYKNGSTEIKKKILQTLFPQKLIYTPEYFITSHLDETLALILFREKELKYLKVAEKSKVAS